MKDHSSAIAETVGALRTQVATPALQPLPNDPNIEQFVAHLNRISLAWPVELAVVTLPNDRRSALLAAPLFTSDSYPWPRKDGRWLEPVLQINLASLAGLKPLPLGSGWLQVWAADSGATVRIVPDEHVATAQITALPSANPTDYHCNRVASADEAGAIGWLPGQRISGFGEPFLDYGHNDLSYQLDRVIEESLDLLPERVGVLLHKLRSLIASPEWYPLVARAFGMVNESDVAAYEYPPVLFVLEEGAPLLDSFNGADGAYVCYVLDGTNPPTFSVRGPHL